MEERIISYEELEKMYNDLVITNGEDYWRLIILEYLINNQDLLKEAFEERDIHNLNITEEKINNMVYNIMENDNLWQEIDYALENAIEEVAK